MKQKSLFGLLVLLILALALVACGSDEPEETAEESVGETSSDLVADLGGREVTIAIENQYLPFNYINAQTGEAAGWDYEAWDEICKLINCVPVFVEAGWEGMIQAVADGQYDAAADGITITAERAEIVDFSDGYIALEQRLLARSDEERFSTVEEVQADAGLVVGTQTGTTNYEVALQYFDEDRISAYETFPFAVQALLSGDVDVVVMDETAGQGYVGADADKLKLIGEPLSEGEQLGFIYGKGSDLVEPVNKALAEMKSNGTLETLAQKYFTDAFTITYNDIEEITYE